jgi:SAM-dependent methyltransferase
MAEADVQAQMRAEWNERAAEDAHYYVAYGARDQDDETFFATAADVVRGLEAELKRLPLQPVNARRALEIGCGPGRLMKPMSRHFGEIHGVDVADAMIERARRNLLDVPHAFPRAASGSDLSEFGSDWFDFVYSYAVFQHIPSREVVLSYWRDIVRVLKPGGIARLQINGLPRENDEYTTWSGARFSGAEIREFTCTHGLHLLALDGEQTQYMWTTWRKPVNTAVAIRSISNAFTGERAVPASGRLACASLWVENLPGDCELNELTARMDGIAVEGCYVGAPENGISQLNFFLPPNTRTGLVPVELLRKGEPLCQPATLRVIPPGPVVPRITAVTDGVNLLSDRRIETRAVKLLMEEIANPQLVGITIDDLPVQSLQIFCIDPVSQAYDCSFLLPEGMGVGAHVLQVKVGARLLAPVGIAVV